MEILSKGVRILGVGELAESDRKSGRKLKEGLMKTNRSHMQEVNDVYKKQTLEDQMETARDICEAFDQRRVEICTMINCMAVGEKRNILIENLFQQAYAIQSYLEATGQLFRKEDGEGGGVGVGEEDAAKVESGDVEALNKKLKAMGVCRQQRRKAVRKAERAQKKGAKFAEIQL